MSEFIVEKFVMRLRYAPRIPFRRGPLRALAGCLILAFAAFAAGNLRADSVGKQPFRAVAVRDARIVVSPGKTIEKGSILIRDGVIAAVGEKVEIPFDADVIDGTGLTAYAGFIDAASSVGVPKELDKERHSGSGADLKIDIMRGALATTREVDRKAIFPDYSVAENLKLAPDDLKAWRKAGFAAVHAVPGAALLAGKSALLLLLDEEDAPRRDTVARGDALMIGGWRAPGAGYPRSLMGSVAHLRQTLLDAGHYGEGAALAERIKDEAARPAHDPAMEALLPVLRGDMALALPASSRDEIHRALSFAAEFETKPVLLGGELAYKTPERIKQSKAPVILSIGFPDKPEKGVKSLARLRDVANRYGVEVPKEMEEQAKNADKARRVSEPDRAFEDRLQLWNERVANAKVLADAKIPFALGTQGNKDPKQFWENFAKAVEAGLPKDAALAALTTTPAEILGAGKLMGTLEAGKLGNVTLMEGQLGEKDAKIKATIVRGRKYEPEAAKDEKKDEKKEGEAGKEVAAEADKSEKESKAGEGEKKEEKAGEPKNAPPADWAVETDADRVPKTRTGGNALIKNATVLTMLGETLEGTSILIKKGVIAEVGKDIAAPSDFTVIDGTGAWVMPGIIDCHSHMSIDAGVNEATDSITAQVRIADVVVGDDITMYRAAAGGVTAANLLHGSANTIGGQRAIVHMKYNEPADAVFFSGFAPGIKFALGENVTRSRSRFPNTRMGVEAVIRRGFREAQLYQAKQDAYEALGKREKARTPAPRRDLRLEALAEVLSGKRLVHCHSYNADEIAMVLGVFKEFGIKNLTLEHGLEAFKIAPEIADFGAYVSSFADNWAYKIEAYDAIPYNVALVEEAGGVGILNSDSGERGRRMTQEAAKMVRFGALSYEAALKTITLNPARALRMDSRAGSVAVGKGADLALFNGHPLNNFSRCFMTFVDGEVVFERPGDRGGPFPLEEKKHGLPADPAPANAQGRYLITNATLHPISGPVIAKGALLIEGGKIAALGAELAAPAETTIVDARGMDVYPGMIDAGSSLGLNEIEALAVTMDASEAGGIQPDLKAAVAVKPDSELIPVARFTGITSAVSNPTGGLIPGQSAMIQLAGWTPKELAYVDQLALELNVPRMGSIDIAGLFQTESGGGDKRPTAEEQIEKLKRLFADAKKYATMSAEAERRGEKLAIYEPDLEALAPFVRKDRPVVFVADAAAEILEAIDLAAALDVRGVLRGGGEAWKVAKQLAEAKMPVIVGPVTELPADFYDPYDSAFANPARLNEAGVPFCFQSNNASDSRNLPFGAGLAVAYGLPREAAMRALTLGAAEIYGISDRVGSLEPGKRADLIIVDGDPLQITATVQHLFIAGKPVDLKDNKHTQLYLKYRGRIAPAPIPGGGQ